MHNKELLLPDEQRPQRADALKNRALLLKTAERLFSEQGISHVSMSAIAETAGVGKGTLYRHFRSKDEVAHALLDSEARDLQNRALQRLRSNDDPHDNLRWLTEQIARYINCHLDILHLEAPLLHPAHFWWRQMMIGLLVQSTLAPETDVEYLGDTLHTMLDVRTIRFQRHQLGYDIERIIHGLHTLLDHIVS